MPRPLTALEAWPKPPKIYSLWFGGPAMLRGVMASLSYMEFLLLRFGLGDGTILFLQGDWIELLGYQP